MPKKLLLVEDLWDELASHPNGILLSSSMKAELDLRYAEDVKRRLAAS